MGKQAARLEVPDRVGWPLYREFEVEKTDTDTFLVARRSMPKPEEHGVGITDDKVRIYSPGDLFQDENLDRIYSPLRDEPNLFLEFAELGRRELERGNPLTLEDMQNWIKKYGVLGLEGVDVVGIYDGEGRRESLRRFRECAREMASALELFNALTGRELHKTLLREHGFSTDEKHLEESIALAWTTVEQRVLPHVRAYCYETSYRFTDMDRRKVWHRSGPGFTSLFGAMHLQFKRMMENRGERRCAALDCDEIVAVGTMPDAPEYTGPKAGKPRKYRVRVDKDYHSKACSQRVRDREKAARNRAKAGE